VKLTNNNNIANLSIVGIEFTSKAGAFIIGGGNAMTFTGTNRLILTGSNIYSGITTISADLSGETSKQKGRGTVSAPFE
jgi:autotransporter-associated beta strand protein